jgi:RND family efflux transporter MFP subunit
VSRRALSIGLIASMLLGSACTRLTEVEAPTPTPVPQRADEGKQTYEVQRGSIYDTIKALGRIVGSSESPLYFKQPGRLRSVNVDVMQPVKKGDLLAELDTGDLKWRIETARLQMDIASIELSRQVAQTASVKADVTLAASTLVAAQSEATKAANNVSKLEAGAMPADLAVAGAAVDQARAQLEKAQAQLAGLKQPPPQEEVVAARAALEKARANVQRAQAEYDKIAWRPDAAGRGEAVALQQATADLQAAQANLNLRSQGARPEDVTAVEKAVQSGQENLRAAQARLDQLRAGSRPEDVRAARAAQEKAQQALAETRGAFEAVSSNAAIDTTDFEVRMAQKKVEVARVKFEGLQAELEMARVRAPYDGIITFVTGKQGDNFDAFAPIAIISNPEKFQVALELQSQDLARIAPGQEAVVTSDRLPGAEVHGRVVSLPSLDAGTGSGPLSGGNPRAVKISFEPAQREGLLGQLAQVTVITQQKDNIILIPNTAVRRFGSRKYVQMIGPDGRRRDVDVEIGLVTDTETEITKGLREGQRVIVS